MIRKLFALGLLIASLLAGQVQANDVDTLLKHERPAGVVFELIGSIDLWDKRIPELKNDIERLRKKFPDLPIAIVSHGSEQFALTSKNKTRHSEAHSFVNQLVVEDKIDVHVCGTHASWFDVMPEDFPDYVDVSPAGPAQINDYEELGYELVVIN